MNVDFLDGLRVLELGDGVAGASAAGLLAALGAEVTAVVDPNSPHRRGRPDVARSRLLWRRPRPGQAARRGGRLATVDRALDGPVDLVVVDRVGGMRGVLESLSELDSYLAFVSAQNPGAWLTISAFGLSGPRATTSPPS